MVEINYINTMKFLALVMMVTGSTFVLASSQSSVSYSTQHWPARWSSAIHQKSDQYPTRDTKQKEFQEGTNTVSDGDLFSTLPANYAKVNNYGFNRLNIGTFNSGQATAYNGIRNINYRPAPNRTYQVQTQPWELPNRNYSYGQIPSQMPYYVNANNFMPFGGLPYPAYTAAAYPGFANNPYGLSGLPFSGMPFSGMPFMGTRGPFSPW